MRTVTKSKGSTMKLKRIKITDEFKESLPKPSKLSKRYEFYLKHHFFKEQIVVNKKKELVDGYTTYLLCKMLGIEEIEVKRKYAYIG